MSAQRWSVYWQSEAGEVFIKQSSIYDTPEEAQEYAAGEPEDGYHVLPFSGETIGACGCWLAWV
ncbi:MAG: hypothetical protein HC837_16080 [Chloroflexaceae bacterium]|nr:hypothetical protein [Chloroflexaceae bacterium]